jgi:hypothetical protein
MSLAVVATAYPAARADQAMKLFHRCDHVGEVLDDVDGAQLVERIVGERIGDVIQDAEHIGMAVGIAIDADRAGVLIDPTADVKRSQ